MSSAGDVPRPDDRPRREQPFPAEGHPSGPRPGYGPTPYEARPSGEAFGQAYPPHVYNPYGNVSYPASYPVPPAGLTPDDALPVRRPGSVTIALVLLVLSTVPYVLGGIGSFLVADGVTDVLPPEQRAQLDQAGIDAASLVRGLGVVLLSIALVFVLLAVLAWTGRRWARALVAAMTAGFVLMGLVAILGGASVGAALDVGSLAVLVATLALAAGGVALLFGTPARGWYARSRRPVRT